MKTQTILLQLIGLWWRIRNFTWCVRNSGLANKGWAFSMIKAILARDSRRGASWGQCARRSESCEEKFIFGCQIVEMVKNARVDPVWKITDQLWPLDPRASPATVSWRETLRRRKRVAEGRGGAGRGKGRRRMGLEVKELLSIIELHQKCKRTFSDTKLAHPLSMFEYVSRGINVHGWINGWI